MALAEIGLDARDHGVADLVERIHLGNRFLVVLGDLQAGVVEGVPRAVAARERQRRGLADMAHAERIDEALQRNLSPLLDRGKQIAHRSLAIAFDLFQLELCVALLQREDIGGLPHPSFFEEDTGSASRRAPRYRRRGAKRTVSDARSSGYGQANSPVQRARDPSSPVAVSSRTTSVCSGHGHFFGK